MFVVVLMMTSQVQPHTNKKAYLWWKNNANCGKLVYIVTT